MAEEQMPWGKIYIHKTHSKRELIDMMAHFKINIGNNPTDYNKKELQQVILDVLPKLKDECIIYDTKHRCSCVTDLLNY